MFDIFLLILNIHTSSQGKLTDVIKFTAILFAELPDLHPPVLRSSDF